MLAGGSVIYLVLGSLHLWYTFFSEKFRTHNPAVEEAMKQTSPRLTKLTTMWKAWIGFNASHSTGAMFFGFMILYFSMAGFQMFRESVLLQSVILLNTFFYVWLGKVYWFRIPYGGIVAATICFSMAILLFYLS